MSKDKVLGGFEAVFDSTQPGFTGITDDIEETLKTTMIEKEVDDDDDLDIPVNTKKENIESHDDSDKDVDNDTDDNDIEDTSDDLIVSMFDAFSEQYGWDVEDDKKPNTIEDFMEYVNNTISKKSKPTYSNEDVEKLDEFVRNGGDIKDFISVVSDDLSNIDISDEINQKRIVKQLLKKQGLSDTQISRKLDKYEDAGILEDEAEEALEMLQRTQEKEKEELLEDQKQAKIEYEEAQKAFYTNVLNEVKALKDVRGIVISDAEKKELLDYMLKPTKNGKTRFQDEYAGNVLNLVESAYFTKNKNKVIESAKKAGEKTAIERFKQKLKATSQSKGKQSISVGDTKPLWDLI